MKTFSFVVLSLFFLSGQASPLGDRDILRRHNGIALPRRHLLQSRTDAPPACASLAATLPPVANSTVSTDPSAVAAPATSSNATATRRHLSSSSFSSFDEFDSSFVESVTTLVSTWQSLCFSAGSLSFTDSCLDIGGFNSISALLETADACDQQDIADSMITFAKSDGIRNRGDLINFALGYRKHARHAVKIFDFLPSSLFCTRISTNVELHGVYNEQLEGCNPGIFGSSASALVPFGSEGTCPYGMSADVSTCGCTGGDDSSATDSTSSDDSSDSTDTSSDDTSDSTDSTDSTDGSSDSSVSTDDSTASTDSTDGTDSTDSTDSTDPSSDSTASDTSSTDADSTSASATADPAAAAALPFATPTDTSGPNVQPTDISGNVNDPEGR